MSKFLQISATQLINLDNVENVTYSGTIAFTYKFIDASTIVDTRGSTIEAQQVLTNMIAAFNGSANFYTIPTPVAPGALSIATITPSSLPGSSGGNALITGGGFTKAKLHVAVGGIECPVTAVIDDTHCNIIVPPSASGGALANQPVDVWYDFDVFGGPTDHALATAFSWT